MNKFVYESGDLNIGKSQCELCKNFISEDSVSCRVFDKRDENIILGIRRCKCFEGKNEGCPFLKR